MTIDEAIKRAEEIAEYNQKVVDTHHISDDISLDELYADDTEIIDEQLEGYKECADDYSQLSEWLKDYKRLLEQQPCEDCISRANALRVANNEYLRGWHNALCKALSEKYSIHCEEGNFNVIQEETITGLGLSMDCAVGKDVESYMSTIPSVIPKGVTVTDFADKCRECGKQTRWIPVSERLPDDEQMVLVCSNNGSVEVSCGSRSTEIKDKFIWYTSGWKFGKAIAWQSLPKPYKAEMESEE